MSDTTSIIEAENIDKAYGAHRALRSVSISVANGEFLALVGPSGCGKTSLLKILAGFEAPNAGHLNIDGMNMLGVPPSRRPTRMVFQKLALFPHKTVSENIAFPLRVAKRPKAEIARRVDNIMQMMRLPGHYCDRYPSQLSGGEQQRVALARAMISQPSVLLLDEPLSALDAKLRKSLQAEIKDLHRRVGTSFVHVTHDLEEAMMLADRICVMRDGEIVQVGGPTEIYRNPIDTFVAGFIGETNLIPVTVARRNTGLVFVNTAINCHEALVPAHQAAEGVEPGVAALMIRPEILTLGHAPDPDAECRMTGKVKEVFVKGGSVQYQVQVPDLDDAMIVERRGGASPIAQVGDSVHLGFRLSDVFLVKKGDRNDGAD